MRPDRVWSADITSVRLRRRFVYLTATLDWYSRYVVSWALSQSLEAALAGGAPEIFNSDQGVQFTSEAFTGLLERRGVAISKDGPGRVFDNIFSQRLWRTVKYEEVHLKDYADPREARDGLAAYFQFYNDERPHQALGYRTPAEVYSARAGGEDDCATARTVGRAVKYVWGRLRAEGVRASGAMGEGGAVRAPREPDSGSF